MSPCTKPTNRTAGCAAVATLLLLSSIGGCADSSGNSSKNGSNSGGGAESRLLVVTTTGMVADVVLNVGGDHVSVLEAGAERIERGGAQLRIVQLMGADVDPHLYKTSPGDVSLLNKADVIFYSGLHLEGKMTDLFERMAARKPTIALTGRLEKSEPDKLLEVDEGYHDPHVWFDAALWRETVAVVADELARLDPERADDYQANAESYRTELDELHTYCKEQLATIPRQRRVLVTAHDAFHYFGRAYGLEVKAIQGVSTDSEASARHIDELVEFIVSRRIKAVFVETTVSDHNIKLLIEGCAARDHTVKIGGELFSDAPGKPGTEEGTYIGMVRHNVDVIVKALK